MRRWTAALTLRRVVLAIAATVAAALLLVGVTLVDALQDVSSSDAAVRRWLAAQADTSALRGLWLDEETGLRGYLVAGQQVFLQPYEQAQPRIPVLVARLQAAIGGERALRAELAGAVDAQGQWREQYAARELALVRAGRLPEARAMLATGHGKILFDEVRSRVTQLQQSLEARALAAADEGRVLERRLVALLVGVVALLAVVVTGTVVGILRGLVAPLAQLAAASRQVAADQLDVPLRVDTGPPEVRSLGADLDAMRRRLASEVEATRAAIEAVVQDTPAVWALHRALSRPPVRVPGLEVAARLDPAEGLLAGDWYDVVAVDRGRVCLVLGDVAGHGAASAVFALSLKHTIAMALCATAGDPGEALARTARTLTDVDAELFATVFLLTVDVPARRLRYASAGHPPGLLARAARPPAVRLRAAELASSRERGQEGAVTTRLDLPATGPLLSPMTVSCSWASVVHTFEPGDVLVAYTDGVLEARAPDGELYGDERVRYVVDRHLVGGPAVDRPAVDRPAVDRQDVDRQDVDRHGGGGLAGLVASVLDDAAGHTRGARAADDRTVLAARVLDAGETPRVPRPR